MANHHKREIVSIDRLKPAPYNPREIDDDSMRGLGESLDRFGVVQEVVVNERTGHIVGGHQRVKALRAAGVEDVPVVWVDLDDSEERALNLALNSPHISGRYTSDVSAMLEELVSEVPDLVDGLRLDKIAEDFAAAAPSPPEEPEGGDGGTGEGGGDDEPDSEPGRVYQLGPHRVACGDSTNSDTIDGLMLGKRARLLCTDPPYNIAGEGENYAANAEQTTRYRELQDAGWDDAFRFADVMPNIDRAVDDDAAAYVFTSHFLFGEVLEHMRAAFRYTQACVWTKTNPMPSLAKRHWTWATELIVYATRGAHVFNFPDSGNAPNSFSFSNTSRDVSTTESHPTRKPIDVIEHLIKHSSKRGDLVLDLFLGSGTTLIGCARLGRVCFGVEREPKHVDSVRRRWREWAESVGTDPGPDAL